MKRTETRLCLCIYVFYEELVLINEVECVGSPRASPLAQLIFLKPRHGMETDLKLKQHIASYAGVPVGQSYVEGNEGGSSLRRFGFV